MLTSNEVVCPDHSLLFSGGTNLECRRGQFLTARARECGKLSHGSFEVLGSDVVECARPPTSWRVAALLSRVVRGAK